MKPVAFCPCFWRWRANTVLTEAPTPLVHHTRKLCDAMRLRGYAIVLDPHTQPPTPDRDAVRGHHTAPHKDSLVLYPVDVPHHALHLHRRLRHARRPHLQPTPRRARGTSAPCTSTRALTWAHVESSAEPRFRDGQHGARHAANDAEHSRACSVIAAAWPTCIWACVQGRGAHRRSACHAGVAAVWVKLQAQPPHLGGRQRAEPRHLELVHTTGIVAARVVGGLRVRSARVWLSCVG